MTEHHDDRIGINTLRLLAERSDDLFVSRICTEVLTLRAEIKQLRADLRDVAERMAKHKETP